MTRPDQSMLADNAEQIAEWNGALGQRWVAMQREINRIVVPFGDAAHFKENFDNRRVPAFNFNKEQSVQSMDKLARVVATEHAQLWINHDRAQSAGIPHSPQFVD